MSYRRQQKFHFIYFEREAKNSRKSNQQWGAQESIQVLKVTIAIITVLAKNPNGGRQ